MVRHSKYEGALTIADAVDTLTQIADLDVEHVESVDSDLHEDELLQLKPATQVIYWLAHRDIDHATDVVKESFKVILSYLKAFNAHQAGDVSIERIKSIMLLVGEAAGKMERCTHLFKKKTPPILESKEYKRLQTFYKDKIARKVEEGMLSKWLAALSQTILKGKIEKAAQAHDMKHVFVDLDAVKRDTEYELFFIRKEDGTRFFSPRLVRTIELVCNFEPSHVEMIGDDPLKNAIFWVDRIAHTNAKQILERVRPFLRIFYRDAPHYPESELVHALNKSIIALMIAANPQNLKHQENLKSAIDYFADFQFFLRTVLYTREYHMLSAYPGKRNNQLTQCLVSMTNAMCSCIYTNLTGSHACKDIIMDVIRSARVHGKANERQNATLASELQADYASMQKMMRLHPNGPLHKVLEMIEYGNYNVFDSILQGNVPGVLYELDLPYNIVTALRLPAPTRQEFINKAAINDEFKAFLRDQEEGRESSCLLIFNEQDRTSWKEHARALCIENVPDNEKFKRTVEVVTLAKDTDFYHQTASYAQDHQTKLFYQHLKEHCLGEGTGFYFPAKIKQRLEQEFDSLFHSVHKLFFHERNVLSKEDRMIFVDLFYLFIELLAIDILTPNYFACCCKDGVDTSVASQTLLFSFLNIMKGELSAEARDEATFMVFNYPLVLRERLMLHERFDRLVNALKTIEECHEEMGHERFVLCVQDLFGACLDHPLGKPRILESEK